LHILEHFYFLTFDTYLIDIEETVILQYNTLYIGLTLED